MKRKSRSWVFIIILLIILIGIVAILMLFIIPKKNDSCDYNDPTKSYIKKDPNCFINFACIKGTEAFKDSCGCGCKKIVVEPTINCSQFTSTNCPKNCSVCPNCAECSAVTCHTKDFCNNLGFNETWQNQTQPNYCTTESRNAQVCNDIYQPVCGWFSQNIKCIKYPCANTYSNSCNACQNKDVEYYIDGECPK